MAVWNVDEPVYYIRELMFSSPLHLIRHNKYMWISVVTNFYKRFLRYIDSRFPYLFVSNMVAWESLLFFTFTRNLAIHNLSVLLRRQLTIFATLLTMSGGVYCWSVYLSSRLFLIPCEVDRPYDPAIYSSHISHMLSWLIRRLVMNDCTVILLSMYYSCFFNWRYKNISINRHTKSFKFSKLRSF